MSSIRRVMYASDFSSASLAALPLAINVAKATGAELLIMHVLPSPLPLVGEGYIDQATLDRLFAGARAEAHKQLEPLLARAHEAGIQTSGFIVDDVGAVSTADEIIRAAIDKEVDILVLGTHGRTGIAKFFLGSVAARVVATAPCPVLTVRAAERATQSATSKRSHSE
jgi:nucleotide-binding universal stress UspA family protein